MQQPTSSANIHITEQGMLIQIILAPGLALTQTINAEGVDAIMREWLKVKREQKRIADNIHALERNVPFH